MEIKLLGTGCPNCLKLENNTNEAIKELEKSFTINKITKIEEIMGYGVMNLPAIIVDNKIICSGRVPDVEEIKQMLEELTNEDENSINKSCSCCDHC